MHAKGTQNLMHRWQTNKHTHSNISTAPTLLVSAATAQSFHKAGGLASRGCLPPLQDTRGTAEEVPDSDCALQLSESSYMADEGCKEEQL